MKRSAFILTLVTLSLVAAGRTVWAQGASAARFVCFHARPGSKAQLEDAIKQQMDWRREQKDSWRWLTWEYMSGEVPRYCVATFGHAWADFDQAPVTGREEERFDAAAAALSSQPPVVRYFEHLVEVSDFGSQTNTPTLAEISLYQLHYGKTAQFYGALAGFHDALSRTEGGQRYEWFELRSGGETPQFMLMVPRANWEAFAINSSLFLERLEDALGKREAAKVFDQFTSAVKSHQRIAVRFRPDLSLLSTPESAKQ